jgi:hypothetical protein
VQTQLSFTKNELRVSADGENKNEKKMFTAAWEV